MAGVGTVSTETGETEPTLDLDFIRAQFPAFSEPSLDGWAFFENAGGSYACRQTVSRLHDFYTQTKVQPYGPFPAATKGGQLMDDAYVRLAGAMNVGQDEVHIGPSTSQNTYVLSKAFRETWEDGDEIIVTNQDHEANSGVWRRLADTGITVREWKVDPQTGTLDPTDLAELFTDKTRLVAFPHVSNIIGHINPVAEICEMIADAGAVSVVDGVSAAPHGLPDVSTLGADIYLFSAYKTWGPHQGVMTVKRAVCHGLPNQSHYFNESYLRKKLLPAGPDHAQIAAMNGVVDYIDTVHEAHFDDGALPSERAQRVHDLFRRTETDLLTPLLDSLRDNPKARLLGPDDPVTRVPTVALLTERNPGEIATEMLDKKIGADSGNFYAVRVLDAMGVPLDPGVLRLSFVHYTSPDEVARLSEALAESL